MLWLTEHIIEVIAHFNDVIMGFLSGHSRLMWEALATLLFVLAMIRFIAVYY